MKSPRPPTFVHPPTHTCKPDANTQKRDKLIAAVRRNSRLAYLKQQEAAETASESMQSAWADLTNSMIDTWSESQLEEFCDKNGITGTSYSIELHCPSHNQLLVRGLTRT